MSLFTAPDVAHVFDEEAHARRLKRGFETGTLQLGKLYTTRQKLALERTFNLLGKGYDPVWFEACLGKELKWKLVNEKNARVK